MCYAAILRRPENPGMKFDMIRLENERRSRGMSRKTLAGLIGLHSVSTVSRWEIGSRHKPYPRHARKLEEIFGVTVAELFAPHNENGAAQENGAAETRSAKNEVV